MKRRIGFEWMWVVKWLAEAAATLSQLKQLKRSGI